MKLLGGGVGRSRIVFGGDDESGPSRAIGLVRTGPATWGTPQLLERGAGDFAVAETLGDGSAALVYGHGRQVRVRTAAEGAPFGPTTVIATLPSPWQLDQVSVAGDRSGAAVVAWSAVSDDGTICGDDTCFGRVFAATRPPGGSFGPPQVLSPLGTVLDTRYGEGTLLLTASAEMGRRLAAWYTGPRDVSGLAGAWATVGDTLADSLPSSDARPPKARVRFLPTAVPAAIRTGVLSAELRCDEPCALRISLYDDDLDDGVDGLRAVVLDHPGALRATWHVTHRDRRILRDVASGDSTYILGQITDEAGNVHAIQQRLKTKRRSAKPS
jgi:hypothetical protein